MSVRTLVKSIQDIMRKDTGVDGDAQRISQLCWMFFLKIIDDQDQELELTKDNYVSPIPANLQWRTWAADPEGTEAGDRLPVSSSLSVLLSDAMAIYLQQKGKGRPVTFHRAAERACGYVIGACGDKQLDVYTKADANAFRDALISRGLAGSSLTRVFGTVRAVTNFAASEQGMTMNNPFAGVYYDRTAGVSDRNSIPGEALRVIQGKCREIDDDLRWLVAMVSDTVMRLAEAAGLTREDIMRQDDGSLVARVRPHPWRRLKTKGSERDVPLEGQARWAAERLLGQQ